MSDDAEIVGDGAGSDELPREFRPENEADVLLLMRYADGDLSAGDARRVEGRLAVDPAFTLLAHPIVAAWRAAPPPPAEASQRWARFRLRAGMGVGSAAASDPAGALPAETGPPYDQLPGGEQAQLFGGGGGAVPALSGRDIELIARYMSGSLPRSECEMVQTRLERDPGFAAGAGPLIAAWIPPVPPHRRLERVWRAVGRMLGFLPGALPLGSAAAARENTLSDESLLAESVARDRDRRRFMHALAWRPYAAIAGAVCLLAGPIWFFARDEVRARVGHHGARFGDGLAAGLAAPARVMLVDGSRVDVGRGARLGTGAFTAAHRTVQLAGTATFAVATEGRVPFVVETMNASVTATGTLFIVRTDSVDTVARTEIDLEEGSVEIRALPAPPREPPLRLRRGDRAQVLGTGLPVRVIGVAHPPPGQ